MSRNELNDHLRGIETSSDYLKDNAKKAHQQLQSWSRSGFPSDTGLDRVRSSGSTSSSVENAALNPDEPTRQAKRLESLIRRSNLALGEAESITRMTMTPPERKERVNQVPECLNCSEPCVPRARRGLCPACYMYRQRNNEDRPT